MELLQLTYYTAVVEAGTINGGAKKLGMTQPPVSTQIRLLEEELGCTLFERGSRQIRLTEEGRLFYERAVRILRMTQSAAAAVADGRRAERGTLRIGVVSSLADLAAEKWFRGFARRYPLVNYEVTEGSTYELLDKLQNRLLDVALVRTPFSARGFTCFHLAPEDMMVMGTGELLSSLPEAVTLKEAASLPLVLYRRWAEVLDRAFAAQGCKPRVLCVADDARTCVAWAAAGLGAAVVPADMMAVSAAAHLTARPLRGLVPAAETTLAMNEGGCDTAVGRAFAAYFKEC